MSAPETTPKKRGCFFYGCLSCIIAAILIAVTGFLGVRFLVGRINATIMEYTEASPRALPTVDMPTNEIAQLKERAAAFGRALDAHTNTPPLILTGPEINVLLRTAQQTKDAKLNERFYVSLEGEHIKAQTSLPLDEFPQLPLIHTKGRYLNGVADVTATVTNAAVSMNINSVMVKGKPLPAQLLMQMQQFQRQMLSQNVNNNPTNAPYLERLESVEVKDGTMILKAKQP